MTTFAGMLMILAVAAAVTAPLLGRDTAPSAEAKPADAAEVLEREKGVALLAIKEADFDLAMGKLSPEDYSKLRKLYEERALGALGKLDALDRTAAAPARAPRSPAVSYCTACGERFGRKDRFCGSCGHTRDATPA